MPTAKPAKFLARLSGDLKRSLAELQRAAIVSVLRARLGELTLDDVHQLIASPLGAGLGSVRVLDLLDGAAKSAEVRSTAPARPARPRPHTTKSKKRNSRPRTNDSTSSEALARSVVRVLEKTTEPLRRRAIAAHLGVKPSAIRNALRVLVYDGTLGTEGPASQRLYSLSRKAAESTITPAGDAEPRRRKKRAKGRPARAKRGKGKPGPSRGVSPEKNAELARYGAAILDTIKNAGGWIRSGVLRKLTGGTKEQYRRAVRKLEASGAIVRRGIKRTTEFTIADTPTPA